jgi:hypothetical protein
MADGALHAQGTRTLTDGKLTLSRRGAKPRSFREKPFASLRLSGEMNDQKLLLLIKINEYARIDAKKEIVICRK